MIKESISPASAGGIGMRVPDFKGVAKIELFEQNKKVHEVVEKNMMTNALRNIFSGIPPQYACQSDMYSNISSDFMPIATTSLGGLFLWDENIEENPDMIYPPSEVNCVGHAGGAYSGARASRGTYNANESGAIENGQRHVWDFGTDRGNGTIKCLSLTHANGGNRGWLSENSDFVATFDVLGNGGNGEAYYNASSSAWTLYIYHKDGVKYVIGQNGTTLYGAEYVDTKNIGLLDGSLTAEFTTRPSPVLATLGSNGSCHVYGDKIHQIYPTSTTSFKHDIYDFGGTLESSKAVTVSGGVLHNLTANSGVFYNGHYYLCRTTNVLSRWTSEGAYVDDTDFGIRISNSAVYHDPTSDRLFIGDACLSGDGKTFLTALIRATSGSSPARGLGLSPDLPAPLARTSVSSSGSTSYTSGQTYIGVNLLYLATINNLATPIVKTSAQAMKITYEITQET